MTDPILFNLPETLRLVASHVSIRVPPLSDPHASPCRRAAVAIILRRPPGEATGTLDIRSLLSAHDDLADLTRQQDLEILYIVRAKHKNDPWSGHVAFPGGKRDPEDTSDRVTAEREALEEVGLDLQDSNFAYIGLLDEIATPKRLSRSASRTARPPPRIIVVPHVFLQLSPDTPPFAVSVGEVACTHWISLSRLAVSFPPTHTTPVSLASYVLPRPLHALLPLLHHISGAILLPAIPLLPDHAAPPLLWGITLTLSSRLLRLTAPLRPYHRAFPYHITSWPWRLASYVFEPFHHPHAFGLLGLIICSSPLALALLYLKR